MEKIFKAKRLDNGEWVEFNFNQCSGADTSNGYRVNLTDNLYYSNIVRVDPETMCQCTAEDDSQGNRIFEGDILVDTVLIEYIISMSGDRGVVAKRLDGEPLKGIVPLCYEFKLIYNHLTLTGHNIHDKR